MNLFQLGKQAALKLRRKRLLKSPSESEMREALHAESNNQQDPYSFGRAIHDRQVSKSMLHGAGTESNGLMPRATETKS